MTLVFLDTETTGLDPDRHEIWELAYAIDAGPIHSGTIVHSLRHADPVALRLNGYYDRVHALAEQTQMHDLELGAKIALDGATLVAANPAFDAAFLRARWGATPWHYRMLDIEAFAAGILGWDAPKGLRDISEALNRLGFTVPSPDHSAGADVDTLRECYYALRRIQADRK